MNIRTALAAALLCGILAAGAAAATRPAVVKLRQTSLGRILVDSRGRALYLFQADKGPRSVCYGGCAAAWPPLLTKGKPVAAKGVGASLLGTTKRRDGRLQVTYHGHPLYFYVGDVKAGQTSGQGINGFGGLWYVLSAKGVKIDRDAAKVPAATTTTSTTPRYTYP